MIELPMYLKLAHITYSDMQDQEDTGVLFDQEKAVSLIRELETRMQEIEQEVQPELPKREPLKGELKAMTPPKLQFKKDGTPSANALKWFDEIISHFDAGWIYYSGIKNGVEVNLPHHKPIVTDVAMTMSNQEALKKHLMSLGWKPTLWNFKQKKNQYGKMEKVRENGRYVKTAPKLQENGKVCPGLKRIADQFPYVAKIIEWLTLRHRLSTVQGWMNTPRLKVDGRLSARATGLTNTKRQRHSEVVNVPRPGTLYGAEMRSLFIAPEGYRIVGYDAASLEDRIKAHFLYKYDGGEFARKILSGNYDPHQESADIWGLARSRAKNGNYALQYLCQPPTLAKTLGCSLEEAMEYHRLYWGHNWALAEFVEAVTRYWEKTGKKYVKLIDGSIVYTRAQHSVANSVMQGSGAKLMDMSNAYMRKWIREEKLDAKRILYMHDECQYEALEQIAEHVGELGCRSIERAGEFFKMKVPFTGEYKVGKNWSDTH